MFLIIVGLLSYIIYLHAAVIPGGAREDGAPLVTDVPINHGQIFSPTPEDGGESISSNEE